MSPSYYEILAKTIFNQRYSAQSSPPLSPLEIAMLQQAQQKGNANMTSKMSVEITFKVEISDVAKILEDQTLIKLPETSRYITQDHINLLNDTIEKMKKSTSIDWSKIE